MRKLYTIILLVIISAVGFLWQIVSLSLDYYPIANFPPRGAHIIALGDSLTEGIGASDKEHGYVHVLEERLGVSMENKGVSGDTTKKALERLDRDVLALNPDIVIVFLGGNDFIARTPKEDVFGNLRTIITRIQSKGAVVILVGVQNGILGDSYAKDFKNLARETKSAFVPNVLDGIIGNSAKMADEVHPNNKGYLSVADKIAPVLEGLIVNISSQKNSHPLE